MTLLLLAYLGGVLTIVSPCILPVLPFVFARADQPFVRSGLPLLVGMALMFAGVATLATVGGGWAIRANEYGRYAALALLAFVGLTLLSSRFADRVMQPVVALGDRLSQRAGRSGSNSGFGASLLLGAATGLLWAPCAGPILGLILTGAAINGGSARTTLLLLAYAAGSATSLAAALIIGGRVFTAMKRSLGAGEWIRRGLGVAVLAGVVAIALGLDTGALTQLALANTARIEQTLLDQTSASSRATSESLAAGDLAVEGAMPPLDGAVTWINSSPLTTQELRGKVVLVDFWTYSCINCLRALPYVRAWAEKYKDRGLVVIGVHTPEFAFEENLANVQRAVRELDVAYPVAVDSDFAIWRAFNNHYWPAHYFVDAQGRVRHHHFGEGEYAQSERVIQTLLSETGSRDIPNDTVDPRADGVQANADTSEVASPETYVGFAPWLAFRIGSDHARCSASVRSADDASAQPVGTDGRVGDWRRAGYAQRCLWLD